MNRFFIGLTVVVAITVTALGVQAAFDAEKQSLGSHVAPPKAEVSAPTPTAQGEEHAAVAAIGFLVDTIDGQLRDGIWNAVVEDLARERAVRGSGRGAGSGASPSVECGNAVLPEHIVERESRGRCDAFNPTGCGGRGCIGYAQIDQGHFAEVSPWNPNVPGSCYGLSYNECVEKLWDGGNGAGHWR